MFRFFVQINNVKKKTAARLGRKKDMRPKHSIDTSIILSYLIRDKNEYQCTRYLARMGYLYNSYVSSPMIGELIAVVAIKHRKKSIEIINDFAILLKNTDFEYSVPKDKAYELYKEIRKLDVTPTDAILLATAVEDKHDVFVTLDTRMLKVRAKIWKDYRIKIMKPEELI